MIVHWQSEPSAADRRCACTHASRKPAAGAHGQLGDGVGLHPEQRRDLGRLHLLDLGVPEHFLPPSRQAAERLMGEPAIEGIVRGLVAGRRIGELVQFVERRLVPGAAPAGGGVADAGEQVGAE
ncbi:hypothetical protein L2X98_21745 [Microbacterium elymi]|uniref:Uncharacterized protein n=1 Tax=Microbacterium elymi TaxID=2909587 RepID=A0ABY5NKV5_9MICO|nr:hypothetical protein [Microbacterium elymi]UUT35810.1 hypothetical protein L2X98_21745 [Microbacterium elymi]